MKSQITDACFAFSTGDSKKALTFIFEDVVWNIVGDREIEGLDAVKEICEEAAKEGPPNFKNIRTIESKFHVICEGANLDSDVYYCDIYTIENDLINEITSYCLSTL
jgi:replication-associated recombination protein RarA